MFCPWLLQGDKIMQFSSWRDLPFFLDFWKVSFVSFLSFFFKNSSVFEKLNLFRIFLCFSLLQVFLPSFFHHFLFLFITFGIHLLFHFLFGWSFYFLDLLLLELGFFEQQFHFWKNSSIYLFLHACVPSLCPFAHTFVHLLSLFLSSFFLVSNTFVSLFLLLFSLSTTSLKDKLKELLQIWKKHLCLFTFLLGTFFIFICLCTKLCEEPDCIFNEICVALFSPLLSFFCNIFSKTYLLRNEIGNAISSFCVTLCLCSLEVSSLYSHFCWFFQQQNKFRHAVVWLKCSKHLVFNYSPSQIVLIKRNLTNKEFFSEEGFFLVFSILFHSRKAFLRTNTFHK